MPIHNQAKGFCDKLSRQDGGREKLMHEATGHLIFAVSSALFICVSLFMIIDGAGAPRAAQGCDG